MAFSNQELNALLNVFTYAGDLDSLSEMIEYDVHKLQEKLMSEMMLQVQYDLDCY